MSYRLLMGLLLVCAATTQAQVRYTTFEKLDSSVHALPRKTFVFINTGWCPYCKMMENTTFRDKRVIQMLNNCFYSISLNAEQRQPITFKGKTYAFRPQGANTGMHELAAVLMKTSAQVAYPALVLLDEHYRIIYRYNGYMNGSQFLRLLQRACAGARDITDKEGKDLQL
jgi:thioredoxin-related protein